MSPPSSLEKPRHPPPLASEHRENTSKVFKEFRLKAKARCCDCLICAGFVSLANPFLGVPWGFSTLLSGANKVPREAGTILKGLIGFYLIVKARI